MRKKRSGLIVNIGSILGRVTIPFIGLYGASKFAVEALTESYRYELSQMGVDVVLMQPSAYPTGLYSATIQPNDASRAQEYGEIAKLPGAFVEFLSGVFGSADAPDSHDVAKALVELIATPAGERADRGHRRVHLTGRDAVNSAVGPIQSQMVAGHWLRAPYQN